MPLKNAIMCLMTNWDHRLMYVGVTNDRVRRRYERKNKLVNVSQRSTTSIKLFTSASTVPEMPPKD